MILALPQALQLNNSRRHDDSVSSSLTGWLVAGSVPGLVPEPGCQSAETAARLERLTPLSPHGLSPLHRHRGGPFFAVHVRRRRRRKATTVRCGLPQPVPIPENTDRFRRWATVFVGRSRYLSSSSSNGPGARPKRKTTTGWKSPKAGIRQLQRIDKALAKRRRQARKK